MCVVCILWSSETPNIFGCVFMGNVILSISRCSLVLYSARSGMNSVQAVFVLCPIS